MGFPEIGPERVEIREISDSDNPPSGCPHCKSPDYIRASYYFRDLQDLGVPGVKRIVRYENIIWRCKVCDTSFAIKHSEVLERYSYMPGVIKYVTHRVLKKGDSARRVLADLRELHNVTVSISTLTKWINEAGDTDELPTDFSHAPPLQDYSGAISIDGTFRSVKAKKNLMRGAENGQPWLRLTHLPDGRLVAYWQEGKMKKKPCTFSKN